MQIERELKFSIGSQAAAGAAGVVPFAARPRRIMLESIYYDTSELRLQRAGAALRLRREGRRWVQTLKLQRGAQGALAERGEWEVAAPGGRLDVTRFRDLPIKLERLRLRPVFATRFERRWAPVALGHGVRAIACIDQGRIEAGRAKAPILELELELQAGEVGPLVGLAEALVEPLGLRIETASKAERGYRLAAGDGQAPPLKWSRPPIEEGAAASDALAAMVAAALAQVAANAPHVGKDPEYLHQLRVGVRRLRSSLRAFRALLKHGRAKAAERPLKRLMRTLGAARDWDVFCEMLVDAEAGAGLLERARRQRAGARREARVLVAGGDFQRAQLQVLRWLHGAPWRSDAARAEPLARFARRSLARLQARLARRSHDIDWHDEPARHAVRIAVKHLRYGCDFFAASFPRQAVQPYLERLAALQDTLGELNDVAVARGLLHDLGSPAETAAVRRWLARRERKLIGALEPAWAAFQSRREFWRARG